MSKKQDMVSTREAADILGVFPPYVYALLHGRLIEGQRMDGFWQISRQSVEQYKLRHPRVGKARAQELQELRA